MKALLLRAPNTPFEMAEVPDPVAGPGEAEALHQRLERGEVTGRAALLIG